MVKYRAMTTAPNFGNSDYPAKGARIGPAWEAAWRVLQDGQWHRSDELAEIMMPAGGVVKITCVGLLRQARKFKILEVRHPKRSDGGAAPAEYRIKP